MGAIYTFTRSKFIITYLLLLSGALILGACGDGGVSEQDREAVYDLIEWNLYYARVEDMNGYMWTLHPESPVYSETQSQMEIAFREFDLAYEIEEWEITSINSESARVRVVQVTRKIDGSQAFSDNRIEGVHTLRKNSEGEWKIYSSEFNTDSIEFLNERTP